MSGRKKRQLFSVHLNALVQVSRYAAGFITFLRISQHLTTDKLNYLMTSPNINAVHIATQA
jgi:hypothetical protein